MNKQAGLILIALSFTVLGYQNCSKGGNSPASEISESANAQLGDAASCKGSLIVGSWSADPTDPNAEVLEFKKDCSGYAKVCKSDFRYEAAESNKGKIKVTIDRTQGDPSACLPAGELQCDYEVNDIGGGRTLSYSCNGASLMLVELQANSTPPNMTETSGTPTPSPTATPSPTPTPTPSPTPKPKPTPKPFKFTVRDPNNSRIYPLAILYIEYPVPPGAAAEQIFANFSRLPTSTASCILGKGGVKYARDGGNLIGIQTIVCGAGVLHLEGKHSGFDSTVVKVEFPAVIVNQFLDIFSAEKDPPIPAQDGSWSVATHGPSEPRLITSWRLEIVSTTGTKCKIEGSKPTYLLCKGRGTVELKTVIKWLDGKESFAIAKIKSK